MNTKLLLIPLALAVSIGGLALAQSIPEGIDLDAVRDRAAEHTEDAEALAANIRGRAESLTEDARSVQETAEANRAAYVKTVATSETGEVLDFDAMVRAQADAEKAALGESPRFIAFASLSMPPAALQTLVRDMGRAGGVTVLRGFPQGDSALFKTRLAAIWQEGDDTGSLGIDPRLFRAFDIEAAPSFVMLASDFTPCDGFDCTSDVPPHDRIAGNISVGQVLETFSGGRGPGAAIAHLHLDRLEQGEPR